MHIDGCANVLLLQVITNTASFHCTWRMPESWFSMQPVWLMVPLLCVWDWC